MKKMTSAQAAKELKKLNTQQAALIAKEKKSSVFIAAIQEDVESVRPTYDYRKTQQELEQLEERIRLLKHSINQFNITQVIPEYGITIDQMLIYIPQLTARKNKLDKMRNRLPREREQDIYGRRGTSIVEYSYSNYDIETVEADYEKTVDELAKAQNALDKINTTVLFDVNI